MSTNEPRRFSHDLKLEVLRRAAAGENISDLSRELGIPSKSIYQWRNRYCMGAATALRNRGRTTKAEAAALAAQLAKPPDALTDQAARQQSLEEIGARQSAQRRQPRGLLPTLAGF